MFLGYFVGIKTQFAAILEISSLREIIWNLTVRNGDIPAFAGMKEKKWKDEEKINT
jgi:hypothetical protein